MRTTEKSVCELFDMTPSKLHKSLYELMRSDFEQEPCYDLILQILDECFQEAFDDSLEASTRQAPPLEASSYQYEWNRSKAVVCQHEVSVLEQRNNLMNANL